MKTVILKLTSAVVIAGAIMRAGELVEVTSTEAKDLLRRGKAEVAGDAEIDDADDIPSSGTTERDLHPAIAAHQDDRAAQEAEQAEQAAADAATAGEGGQDAQAKPHGEQKPAGRARNASK